MHFCKFYDDFDTKSVSRRWIANGLYPGYPQPLYGCGGQGKPSAVRPSEVLTMGFEGPFCSAEPKKFAVIQWGRKREEQSPGLR